MKNSKETRTCIGCRAKKNKKELIRIVKDNDDVRIDFEQKVQSRGVYICKDEKCFDKMVKIKSLNRALKVNISDERYNELRGVIFETIGNKIKYNNCKRG